MAVETAMVKPLNHCIPVEIENEIRNLSPDAIGCFISDLGLALWKGRWDADLKCDVQFSDRTYAYFESQEYNNFKAILQWVAMELI
jgi:hypothetical protein